MRLIALSLPFWHRQIRNPFGVLSLLGLPIVFALIWTLYGGPTERWTGLLLLGWTLGGVVPAALNSRRDETVELRWRSMPVGAAERWGGLFLGLLPLPLISSLLLALVTLGIGPLGHRSPYLLTLGAAVAAVMVALGLAIGSWSRSSWQLAGNMGVILVLCAWALMPGVTGAPLSVIPTGIAKVALQEIVHGPAGVFAAFLELGLVGIVLALVGIVGVGRQ